MASSNRKVQIGISIPLDLLNEIEIITKEKSTSRSSYVVELIRNGMGKQCETCEEKERMEEIARQQHEEHMKSPFGRAKVFIKDWIQSNSITEFTIEDIPIDDNDLEQGDIEHALDYFLSWGRILRASASKFTVIYDS